MANYTLSTVEGGSGDAVKILNVPKAFETTDKKNTKIYLDPMTGNYLSEKIAYPKTQGINDSSIRPNVANKEQATSVLRPDGTLVNFGLTFDTTSSTNSLYIQQYKRDVETGVVSTERGSIQTGAGSTSIESHYMGTLFFMDASKDLGVVSLYHRNSGGYATKLFRVEWNGNFYDITAISGALPATSSRTTAGNRQFIKMDGDATGIFWAASYINNNLTMTSVDINSSVGASQNDLLSGLLDTGFSEYSLENHEEVGYLYRYGSSTSNRFVALRSESLIEVLEYDGTDWNIVAHTVDGGASTTSKAQAGNIMIDNEHFYSIRLESSSGNIQLNWFKIRDEEGVPTVYAGGSETLATSENKQTTARSTNLFKIKSTADKVDLFMIPNHGLGLRDFVRFEIPHASPSEIKYEYQFDSDPSGTLGHRWGVTNGILHGANGFYNSWTSSADFHILPIMFPVCRLFTDLDTIPLGTLQTDSTSTYNLMVTADLKKAVGLTEGELYGSNFALTNDTLLINPGSLKGFSRCVFASSTTKYVSPSAPITTSNGVTLPSYINGNYVLTEANEHNYYEVANASVEKSKDFVLVIVGYDSSSSRGSVIGLIDGIPFGNPGVQRANTDTNVALFEIFETNMVQLNLSHYDSTNTNLFRVYAKRGNV